MSDDLKKEIETQVHVIDENTRKRMFQNMIKRLDTCQAIGGGQFQHQLQSKIFYTINQILIKFWKILTRLDIFEKILTNFIFFIGKLQRNLEMIFDEVITNF